MQDKYISQEDIDKQHKIMEQIKSNNDIEYLKMGNIKKSHIVTFGCQQNENDSEILRGMLKSMGYTNTDQIEEADIIIFNTCCVRENAELKVFGNIGALKKRKQENPDLIIGICGCMMQQEHIVDEIKKKYKHVDLLFGTHSLYKFPEILNNLLEQKNTQIEIMDTKGSIFEGLPIMRESSKKAWVSIMYGCNNYCSYCIVPYVRGRERSRLPQNILDEIKNLVSDGCIEVTLLGQNVNSYGKDLDRELDFADLLEMVSNIEGLQRIRFMTSHPKDISDKLIEVIKKYDNICNHVHLPFQAGSNKILKAMNRKYTKEEYLDKVKRIKNTIPGISLSSDIIVGFPGETDEDFEETLDVVREVEFDQIYMFLYSKRKGTPAHEMEDSMDIKDKKKNFNKLVEVQNKISKKINNSYIGRIEKVLVEGVSKNSDEMLAGRTESNKIVNFKGDKSLIDTIIEVRITEAHSWFLMGEIE